LRHSIDQSRPWYLSALEDSGLSSATGTAGVDQGAHAHRTGRGDSRHGRLAADPRHLRQHELALGFYLDSEFGDTRSAGKLFIASSSRSSSGLDRRLTRVVADLLNPRVEIVDTVERITLPWTTFDHVALCSTTRGVLRQDGWPPAKALFPRRSLLCTDASLTVSDWVHIGLTETLALGKFIHRPVTQHSEFAIAPRDARL